MGECVRRKNTRKCREQHWAPLQKRETCFSILNHIMIGAVSLYVTWHTNHIGFNACTMHVWLSTVEWISRELTKINCSQFSSFFSLKISRSFFSINCCWLKRFWHCTHQIAGHSFMLCAPTGLYKWSARFSQSLVRSMFNNAFHIWKNIYIIYMFLFSSDLISLVLLHRRVMITQIVYSIYFIPFNSSKIQNYFTI